MIKILVIDDDPSIEYLLNEEIRSAGGDVNVVAYASNGVDGVKKYGEYRPSFVFLDMKMPGMNGVETFEKIKEIDSYANVFVVTGYADGNAIDAIKMGVKGYISKSMNYIAMMASLIIAFDNTIIGK